MAKEPDPGNPSKDPSPAKVNIPQQKQLTPEQERAQIRASEFHARIGMLMFFLRRAVLVLLAIGIPAGIVGYFVFGDRNKDPQAVEIADGETESRGDDFEQILVSGSPTELINYSNGLLPQLASGSIPEQLTAATERLKIADRLLEMQPDEETRRFGLTGKVNALMALSALNLTQSLNQPEYSQKLRDFAATIQESQDPAVRSRARLGLLTCDIHDYLLDPGEDRLETVLQRVRNAVSSLTIKDCLEIPKFVRLFGTTKEKQHAIRFSETMSAELIKSELAPAQQIGRQLADFLILEGTEFGMLRQMILVPLPDAIETLKRLTEKVSADPDISYFGYVDLLSSIANLRQIDELTLANDLSYKLESAAKQISDEKTRTSVTQAFENYRLRNELVGKTIQIQNPDFSGEYPIEADKATILFFVSGLSPSGPMDLKSVADLGFFSNLNAQFLVINIDEQADETSVINLKNAMPSAIHITSDDRPWFSDQIPVTWVPYMVVVGADQRVLAVNVNTDRLRQTMEKHGIFED